MKYLHKLNIKLAVACAAVGAIINFMLYGNIFAAVLGAGTLTFLMTLAFSYAADYYVGWKAKRTTKS